jgi:hypothetical protein
VAYRVTVEWRVRAAFRAFGLSRGAANRLFLTMYDNLENHADLFRADRLADPRFFRYQILLADGGRIQAFDFVVDDTREAGRLFVVNVRHQAPP